MLNAWCVAPRVVTMTYDDRLVSGSMMTQNDDAWAAGGIVYAAPAG
jgi:hypothetical protein